MKGLCLSLLAFVLLAVSAAVVSHLVRVERHSRLFWPAFAVWTAIYFVLYFLTPPDLYVLPAATLAERSWLDMGYGFVVFFFNFHSLLDFFFAVNGGFSTCLMLEIKKAGDRGLSTGEIAGMLRAPNGEDKIYAWRIPRLVDTGYLRVGPLGKGVVLTRKGRLVAKVAKFAKRTLNLKSGG